MCFLINKEIEEDKYNSPAPFIYYLVQCCASIIFICAVYFPIHNQFTKEYLMLMCILVKIGVWPFHRWYLKTISLLEIKTNSLKFIITWQKVIPLAIIPLLCLNIENICIVLCIINITIASLSISIHISFKSILGISSMFNNSWLLIRNVRSSLILSYFSFYSIRLTIFINSMWNLNIKKKTSYKEIMFSTIIGSNLAGIPPLVIFSIKVCVLKTLASLQLTITRVFIVILNCIFSYHYLWGLSNNIIILVKKTQNLVNNEKLSWLVIFLISSLGSLWLF